MIVTVKVNLILLLLSLMSIYISLPVPVALCSGFDLIEDGLIDSSDLGVIAERWTNQSCAPDDWCDGVDFNYDGRVDLRDFSLWAIHWLEPKDYSVPAILTDLDIWIIPQPKVVDEIAGAFDLQMCNAIRYVGDVAYSDVNGILDKLAASLDERSGVILTYESGVPADGYILTGVFPDGNLSPGLHGVSADELATLPEQGYILNVDSRGVTIAAKDIVGLSYGTKTLVQAATDRTLLPGLHIQDWPSMSYRGVSQDITRGQTPKISTLKRLVDVVDEAKCNVMELYIQHIYDFVNYPDIAPPEAISPADANEIFTYGKDNLIEVHPFFPVLGWSYYILHLPQYQHLRVGPCEQAPWIMTWDIRLPEAVAMINDLVDELCDAFPGEYITLDITEFDYDAYIDTGSTPEEITDLIFEHVLRLNDVVKQHGKRLMIVQSKLDSTTSLAGLGPKIDAGLFPQDIMIGDYYTAGGPYQPAWEVDFPRLQSHGIDFFAQSWIASHARIMPWVGSAADFSDLEISRGLLYGAKGSVTYDWADAANFHLVGQQWLPFVYHCASAWTGAEHDRDYFYHAFTRQFYGIPDDSVAGAIQLASNIGELAILVDEGSGPFETTTYYFWEFFNNPFDDIYLTRIVDPNGLGQEILLRTNEAVAILQNAYLSATRNQDNIEQLLFGARCFQALGHKLVMIGHYRDANYPSSPLATEKEYIATTYTQLREDFRRLWLEEDRENDILYDVHIPRFDKTIVPCLNSIDPNNLIANNGFETGDFTGWSYVLNATVVSGVAHGGVYSAKVTDVDTGGGLFGYVDQYPVGGNWAAGIASAGETIDLSSWMMSDPTDPIQVSQEVKYQVNFNGYMGSNWVCVINYSDVFLDGTQAAGVWVEGAYSIVVPDEFTEPVYVEIMLHCNDLAPAVGGGSVYSDDWTVNITPVMGD